jgi:hypothetical protein
MRSVSLSLAALARSASDLHRPLGRLNTPSGQICPLDSLSRPNQWPWMHGARCGPIVDEVAVPCGWWGEAKGPITVAADRFAHIVVFEPWGEGLRLPANAEALAVDATLRLLGVSTPPPDETPVELSNTFWLDQLLEICLISPLGEPPPWPILAALHPCATRASIPGLVRHERGFPAPTWKELRVDIINGRVPWVPLAPTLAAWFDEGSLARWLHAGYPDVATMLDELAELLRPVDFERVLATLTSSQQ